MKKQNESALGLRLPGEVNEMRELDLAGLRLVHCGEDWPHESLPCSKEMVKFLERNETLVSWLEPCCGPNNVERQVVDCPGARPT